ncbi:carbohydrate-binding family 9-like protein [Lutibacter sp. TH_r2]|uniref:carbohydrate-binding family 9-like protein n=1 Tax=Lutibacter sp. TH_r2 TaxID=3082083 RepID=UPI002954358D|nr:carbohydrate-binding family 9-like protein [Lutibacter sp. TH_r2]MDV7188136.1 carbohydrate-binding family 9-like protein [Lutibacter sp. TH_r2]
MKTRPIHAYYIIIILTLVSCNTQLDKTKGKTSIYKAIKTSETLTIDGKMNEKDWEKSPVYTLDHFYKAEKPTDKQKTKYRMLWDEENLYLFFECEDQYITARETVRDGTPFLDDCAEIFLIPVPEAIDTHFCFEVNLYNTSNDIVYLDKFYKNSKGVVKAFSPDFKTEVNINGTLNNNSDIDKGWTMEFAIPLVTFRGVNTFHPVEIGTKWRFLAVRQNRDDIDGERRTTSTISSIQNQDSVHKSKYFSLLEFAK